jgi:hypothetical protein
VAPGTPSIPVDVPDEGHRPHRPIKGPLPLLEILCWPYLLPSLLSPEVIETLAPVKFLAGARGRPTPRRLAPVIRLDEGSILAKGIGPIRPHSPGIRRSLPQMLTGIHKFELDFGSNP